MLAVAVGGEGLFERLRGKAVAVVETVRDKGMHGRAVGTERESEQRAGGDAVGVVIAVDEDGFLTEHCLPQPRGGGPYS